MVENTPGSSLPTAPTRYKMRTQERRIAELDPQRTPEGKMRLWLALIVGVQIFIVTSAIAAAWVKFVDPNSQFSVMVPFPPEAKSGTTPKAWDGLPLNAYMVRERTDKVLLVIFDTDCRCTNADRQRVLDEKEAQLLQGATAKVSKPVTLDGEDGHRLTFTDSRGGRNIDQIFFIRNHLYQIIAKVAPTASAQDIEDAERFSNSLHFNH